MSAAAGANPTPTPPDAGDARSAPARHWLVAGIIDTMKRAGAKLGLAWVVIVGLLAILAPFIANSYPILAKVDGKISSPMLGQLSAADITLTVALFAGLILWLVVPLSSFKRVAIWAAIVLVTLVFTLMTVNPKLVPFETYRTGQVSGEVEWAVYTLVPYSPSDRLRDRLGEDHPLEPSFSGHLLGTDRFGQDILSRMIHATRIAMAVGFIAESVSLIIGVIVGGLMGYFAGAVDLFGLRLVEIFSAIPRLYLLLAFVAFFGRNIYLIMLIIGITGWTGYAYFTRAEFLRLRKMDFVQAAQACGLPLRSILFRHMLPNGVAPIIVSIGFGVAGAILYESTLSFLGLGVVDKASWGDLLNQAVTPGGGFYWWLATFPGLAIFLTVFAFNLIGESMRDALDPRMKQQA